MPKSGSRRRRTLFIVLGSLLILLIAARIALPYILLRFVNRELTKIHGYRGHVDDIDVALIRGAYTIKRIKLDKTGGKIPVPFFSAAVIDLSVEWKALFNGALVGEIVARDPTLNFVKGPTAATSQTHVDKSWTQVVDDLMPLKLNRFEIINGSIHYRDFHSDPKVDIYARDIHIVAENLSNAKRHKALLPSTVAGSADVYGGSAKLNMKLDALAAVPTFDLNTALTDLDITHLNNYLRAYGNFDVQRGTISLYVEAAAKDGEIDGYAKPIIKNLKVANWKNDKESLGQKAWETVVGAAAWIFKNHRKNQLATQADFHGSVRNPDVSVWYIIGQVLRNAFIQALYPALDNSVNINSVESKKQKPTLLKKQYEKTRSK
jgi:hypothetical protein